MTTSDNRPNPFVTVWAEDGEKFKTIPELKNDRDKLDDEGNSIHKARATMEEGFPEITMKSAMRGGVPPWGKDHNKILNQITEAIRWFQAGGTAIYDDKLCKKIGGYPEGTILQSSISEDFQVLWFSEAKNNMNNPDTTPSPGNGWVKVDFKDLETRITKNTNDIAALNESKAEKNGSCLTPFKASIMQASQYKFCNPDKTGNGYITQEDKQVKIYSDEHTHFCFPSFNNVNPDRPEISPDYVPTDSAFTLGYDPKGKVTTSYFPATNSFFNGGWIHMQSVLSVENSLTQFTFKNFKAAKGSNKAKDYISWQIAVDSSPKDPEQSQGTENPSEMKGDFILAYYSKVYYDFTEEVAGAIIETEKLEDNTELKRKVVARGMVGLQISAENGDVSASGAFVGSQYKFCNPDKTGNGYITQEDKQVKIYSDEHIHFCFPSYNNRNPKHPEIIPDDVPTDSAFTLGYDPEKKLTTSYFPASNNYFNGGWVHIDRTVLSLENSIYQMHLRNYTVTKGTNAANDVISWQLVADSSKKNTGDDPTDIVKEMKGDFLLTTSSTLNYRKDQLNNTDAAEVIGDDKTKTDDDTVKVGGSQYRLRISHENGDMFVFGAYRNGNSDLAEYYQTDRSDYEPGTLMCHGFDTEAILCQSIDQSDDFFGVISTQPAYIMNGHRQENKNYVLIALNGKVPVKVKGIVKCGDKITIGQDGYGVVSINKNDVIVGRAKENKVTEEVGLVSCYVQAHM